MEDKFDLQDEQLDALWEDIKKELMEDEPILMDLPGEIQDEGDEQTEMEEPLPLLQPEPASEGESKSGDDAVSQAEPVPEPEAEADSSVNPEPAPVQEAEPEGAPKPEGEGTEACRPEQEAEGKPANPEGPEKKGFPKLPYLVIPFVFFSLSVLFFESLLRLTNNNVALLDNGVLCILFSSMAVGSLLWLITTVIANKPVGRGIAAVLLILLGLTCVTEICVKDFFGNYFLLGYMLSMGGDVTGDFMSETIQLVVSHLWLLPLAVAPGILTLVLGKKVVPGHNEQNPRRRLIWGIQVICLVVFQLCNVLLCHTGEVAYYTTEFTANTAVVRYGLVNTLRLELEYSIFGQPKAELPQDEVLIAETALEEEEEEEEETEEAEEAEPEEEEGEEVPEIVAYQDNVLDIDFEALIATDTDSTLMSMDQYFYSQIPTSQNEYTGLFEGKNLIMICAESFSYAVIDEELTPTLYQLSTSGFVFTDFYTPTTTQSTTGGEFTFLTGVLATWVDGGTSFKATASNSMPLGLGWVFSSLGYSSTAYHNNSYTYYSRNLTHPNLGYDFVGVGNGLVLDSVGVWPASDLEMIEATIDQQIQAYVEDGTLFNTYYMTVSGHCNYGWSKNKMSLKNQEAVAELEGSETVLAYIACQLELEYALEYLVNALEEAGIADDTVIVLTADHYPYAMAEGDTDYYVELTGIEDTENDTSRYQNTLILWSGCMDEAVVVDTPCSSIDVVPTLMNLFGIDYDSRLYSGRDILAPDVEIGSVDSSMKVVIFADDGYGYSWITAAGTYEAYTDTFTAAEGVQLENEEDYVQAVSTLVQNRFTYARYIVSEDYYSHIFPNWSEGMTLVEALEAQALSEEIADEAATADE